MSKKDPASSVLGVIRLHRKSKQEQFNVSDDDTQLYFGMAGGQKEQAIGSPKHSDKVQLVYSMRTPKGLLATMIQGDTHAFWKTHQEGDGAKLFEQLLLALPEAGDYCDLEVLTVAIGAGGGKGKAKSLDF